MLSIVSNINASNYKFTYFAPTGTQTDDAECISTSGCSVDIDESNNAIYLSIEDSDQYFEIVNKKIYKRYPYYTAGTIENIGVNIAAIIFCALLHCLIFDSKFISCILIIWFVRK